MLCLSEVYEISQRYKNWYDYTKHRHKDIAGIQFNFFAASFLKLCASVRPVFLLYSPHKYCEKLTRAFLDNHSGCRKNLKNVSVLPPKSQSSVLETEYLGNRN